MDDSTFLLYLGFAWTVGLGLGGAMVLTQSKAAMSLVFAKWFKWKLAMVSDGKGVTHFERLYKHNDKRCFYKDIRTGRPRFLDNSTFENSIVPLRIDGQEISPYSVMDEWSLDSKTARAVTQIIMIARGKKVTDEQSAKLAEELKTPAKPLSEEEKALLMDEQPAEPRKVNPIVEKAKKRLGTPEFPLLNAIPIREQFKIMEMLYCDYDELMQKALKYVVVSDDDIEGMPQFGSDVVGKTKKAAYKLSGEYKDKAASARYALSEELVDEVKKFRLKCKAEPLCDGMSVYDWAYNGVIRPAYDFLIEEIDSQNERSKEDEKKEKEKKHEQNMQRIYLLGGITLFALILLIGTKSVGLI